jgi:hypothetical protein
VIKERIRTSIVMSAVLLAVVLAVQPAAAAKTLSETGKIGPYQVDDFQDTTRGANCVYKKTKTNGKNRLGEINVRPPKMHARDTGAGNQSQKVGWRFIVQQDKEFDGTYKDIFTSSVVKGTATETSIAAFTRRAWTAHSNPKGNYRVKLILIWYKPGSSTTVHGKAQVRIEWYNVKKSNGTSVKIRQSSCYQDLQGS